MIQEFNLQTDTGVSVEKRIKEGLTKTFTCPIKANRYANKVRSYVYDIYGSIKPISKSKLIHCGYGVPK